MDAEAEQTVTHTLATLADPLTVNEQDEPLLADGASILL